MSEARPNPLGVEGFEFVEFAAPDASQLHRLFEKMGFTAVARHLEHDITLYRQGKINFLVNETPDSFAVGFAKEHGPCCTGFALRVADRRDAHRAIIDGGGESMNDVFGTALDVPRVKGIGGSLLYLVDGDDQVWKDAYQRIEGADPNPRGHGLGFIDHLTHNVYQGNMDEWADFYSKHFGFYEVRYFDIRGQQTGLTSRAMTSPTGEISIPINQSSDPKSQINEYLDQYKGEGVQHIALYTDDIYSTVEAMHEEGIEFLDTPDTYYELIDRRVKNHDEDIERMRKNGILIDADEETGEKLLLQIFTQSNIGPIFFEIIQRKGNKGFGEGNFTALFESIELDQMRRGVL
ncbi:MAG: 4-hydroxyphenylpyruvate dioxygenase [Xanthomonadales bacterium]|nr:4-hydroxyphenylpyruvate dioxygenase [Xanthomonadales bacterium]